MPAGSIMPNFSSAAINDLIVLPDEPVYQPISGYDGQDF